MHNGWLGLYLLLCPVDRETHLSAIIAAKQHCCWKLPQGAFTLQSGWKKLYFRANIILLTYFHSLKMFKLGLIKPLITSYWTEIQCADIIFRPMKK